MRSLVHLCLAGFLPLACGNRTEPPAHPPELESTQASVPAKVATVPCSKAPPPESVHLGDGTTSYNYYFIAEELERRPGSEKQAQETVALEREAQQSSGMNALKPPSANVVESEFSHLLGAVLESNGGIGAAVFNAHGLKIGAAGLQLEPMLLPRPRLQAMMQIGPEGASKIERYTCERMRELGTKDCKGDIVGYYRPVFDAEGKAVGVSTLVVEVLPPC